MLSNEELLKLAEKYPPPQSWYEEDFEDLFSVTHGSERKMDASQVSAKQFALRRALTSCFLIAVGMAMLIRLVREIAMPGSVVLPVVLFPIWFVGGAFIGAGISHLKSRWWVGAMLSIPIQIATLFVLFSFFPNY